MGVPTGTLIAVLDGAVPVEGLRTTDLALALIEPRPVYRVMAQTDEDSQLLEIVTEHGSFVVSEEQFVLIHGLWFRADRVEQGDQVVRMLPRWPPPGRKRRRNSERPGTPRTHESVVMVRPLGREPVWDVGVADEHCFWADGFLVRG